MTVRELGGFSEASRPAPPTPVPWTVTSAGALSTLSPSDRPGRTRSLSMLVFGVVIGAEQRYEDVAAPGIRRAWRAGDRLVCLRHQRSMAAAYNRVLAEAAHLPNLEGCVLLHEDTEIRGRDFRPTVLSVLAADDVAVAGAIGARHVKSIAWWEGECRGAIQESRGRIDFGDGSHDVDAVDGHLLVLSPWAVRELRFDESFPGFHAYDVDICFQARAAGRRVVVHDFGAIHHAKGGYGDRRDWLHADRLWRRKWGVADSRFEDQRRRVIQARLAVRAALGGGADDRIVGVLRADA